MGPDFSGTRSNQIVAESSGESVKQVQRYIRLNNLIPELMELVDENKLKFNPAVEISYLTPEEQEDFFQFIDGQDCSPSLSQAQKLKAASREGNLTPDRLEKIMTAAQRKAPRGANLHFDGTCQQVFPQGLHAGANRQPDSANTGSPVPKEES